MRVDVTLIPGELQRVDWHDDVAVVIDVLRASSTLVTLIDQGASTVVPVAHVEQARTLARENSFLLAGERGGQALEGFDFGNSPTEIKQQVSVNRQGVVLTTSNGTAVLKQLPHAGQVLIGCALNRTACCRQALDAAERLTDRIVIVCAGINGRFALDDAACAGLLVETLHNLFWDQGSELELSDGAYAVRKLYRSFSSLEDALVRSNSGRIITSLGYEKDIHYCAQTDITRTVPAVYNEQGMKVKPLQIG